MGMRIVIDKEAVFRWLEEALAQETDSCITDWPFRFNPKGYTVFWDGAEYHNGHRYICRRTRGEPPAPRDDAAHSCGNRVCLNKRHLSWKPHRENLEDRRGHGTLPLGEICYQAVLTEAQVREIRTARGTQQKLADKYGVSAGTVQAVLDRKSWKHLP